MKITPYKVLCFDIEGKNLWGMFTLFHSSDDDSGTDELIYS